MNKILLSITEKKQISYKYFKRTKGEDITNTKESRSANRYNLIIRKYIWRTRSSY